MTIANLVGVDNEIATARPLTVLTTRVRVARLWIIRVWLEATARKGVASAVTLFTTARIDVAVAARPVGQTIGGACLSVDATFVTHFTNVDNRVSAALACTIAGAAIAARRVAVVTVFVRIDHRVATTRVVTIEPTAVGDRVTIRTNTRGWHGHGSVAAIASLVGVDKCVATARLQEVSVDAQAGSSNVALPSVMRQEKLTPLRH